MPKTPKGKKSPKKYKKPEFVRHGSLKGLAERVTGSKKDLD